MHKFRLALVAATALMVATAPSSAGQLDDIVEVVNKYLVGTAEGRPELVREAFLPSLEVQWLGDEEELRRRDAAGYISNIEPGKSVPREGRIVNVDATDKSAMVKVEIKWNDRLYTDYMLLLRVQGEWKIANKIATWEPIDG
ncbi:MAG: nuclear transport factor 2 family protein [Pseudomonadota bacterium]